MRALLALLMFVPALAQAAPLCWPWESTAKNVEVSTPADGGGAFILTWWCDARYYWVAQGVVGDRSDLAAGWLQVLRDAYGDRVKAQALLDRADCKLADPACTKYNHLRPALSAQYHATQPDDIVWKVRTNGTQTTRPVFPMPVGGTRSRTAAQGARVDVGAACACDIQVSTEAGSTYCAVEGNPNAATAASRALPLPAGLVALCVR